MTSPERRTPLHPFLPREGGNASGRRRSVRGVRWPACSTAFGLRACPAGVLAPSYAGGPRPSLRSFFIHRRTPCPYPDLAELASETKEQLVANLRRVVSDAEDLMATAGQTDTKITELRARAKENLHLAREKLAGRRRRFARPCSPGRRTHRRIRARQPWSSIGAAAALGLLIGVLLVVVDPRSETSPLRLISS